MILNNQIHFIIHMNDFNFNYYLNIGYYLNYNHINSYYHDINPNDIPH